MAKLAGNFAAQRSQHNARVPRKAFKDMLDIVGPRGHDFIPNSSILKAAVGGHVMFVIFVTNGSKLLLMHIARAIFVFIQFAINEYDHRVHIHWHQFTFLRGSLTVCMY